MAYNAQIHAEWDISMAHIYFKYTPSKIFVENMLMNIILDFKACLPTLRENITLNFSFNFWMFMC